MKKLAHAKTTDIKGILKLFRRTNDAMVNENNTMWNEGYPNEEIFSNDVNSGQALILKENGRILAYLSTSLDVVASFFPKSLSQRKATELLEIANHKGEPIIILHRLMVDPAFWGQGLGNEMMHYVQSLFPHHLILLDVYEGNEWGKAFFEKQGFSRYENYPSEIKEGMNFDFLYKLI